MSEKSKWIWKGFRKRDVLPLWASELTIKLLTCVKHYTDVIKIDTATRRREQLSILCHHSATFLTHTHACTHATLTEKVHSPDFLPGTKKKNPKQSLFFIFKEEQI